MTPWLETSGVLALLLVTGWSLPGLARSRGWAVCWLGAFVAVGLLGLLRRFPALEANPHLGWLTAGRTEYVLYGPLALLLLGLPGLRISRISLQMLAGTLAVLVCWMVGLAPFLGPALYAAPRARMNGEGICLQSDGVSCGPAAAVTALRRLGLEPDFAALASAAHTSPAIGTPPDLLCQALSRLYPVTARPVYPNRLEDLPPVNACWS